MGGGGFMQHAHDTNRKNRAQRQSRREKFKGNQGEQILNAGNHSGDIEFPLLTQKQITQAREKIKNDYLRNRRKRRWMIGFIFLTVLAAFVLTMALSARL